MNLAVLRPPVCVSGIVVREKERNETRARNQSLDLSATEFG